MQNIPDKRALPHFGYKVPQKGYNQKPGVEDLWSII
jgi:hypothetical protein